MTSVGIILGLMAAVGQALSYLPSRWYVLKRPQSAAQLLAIAHVFQGAVSAPLLWWFWPEDLPPWSTFMGPLIVESFFYFVGQAGLFLALRFTDASRVSPLLTLKLVFLALLSVLWLREPLSVVQWLAVGLTIAAALVLNRSGGSIPWRAGLGLFIAWIGYTLSDFFIRIYVDAMAPMPRLQAGLWGMYASYLICGLVGVAMLPWFGSRRWEDWRDAAPFAFFWFVAMIGFYGSLATAGLVLAGILQSTRSLWSLVIGLLIARMGYHALEQRVPRGVFVRRALGAAMMVAAVMLYVLVPVKNVSDQVIRPDPALQMEAAPTDPLGGPSKGDL